MWTPLRAMPLVAIVLGASAVSAGAQIPAHVDTSKTLTLTGTVMEFTIGPGEHSYLVIETQDGAGKAEIWAVVGNPVGTLMRDGWDLKGAARPGSAVSATAFALKSPANAVDVLGANAPMRVVGAAKAGRYVHGIAVTVGGKTLTFGPSK